MRAAVFRRLRPPENKPAAPHSHVALASGAAVLLYSAAERGFREMRAGEPGGAALRTMSTARRRC